MPPSEENKLIARYLREVFPGSPRVIQHWDDPKQYEVDVLHSVDMPVRGLAAFSTVTLSDTPVMVNGELFAARLELMGICTADRLDFAGALATAAFCIIKDGWECYPGAMFPDVLSLNEISTTLPHLYFTAPTEPALSKITVFGSRSVTWLRAIPISEAEAVFVEEQGDSAFEDLLESSNAMVHDLGRLSIV